MSWLANFPEIAVPAEAVREAARTRYAVFDESLTSVVPLLNQGLTNAQAVTFDGGAPIGADANLRETRDLLGQLFGFLPGAALWRVLPPLGCAADRRRDGEIAAGCGSRPRAGDHPHRT